MSCWPVLLASLGPFCQIITVATTIGVDLWVFVELLVEEGVGLDEEDLVQHL